MSRRVEVVWEDDLVQYNFGRGHPMSPVRVELTMRLARALGVLDAPHVEVVAPGYADDALLQTVHTSALLDAVRRCAADPERVELEFGLGTDDNPCFPGMHDASARVASGTVEMARAVLTGRADHGVNIIGGLHHAREGQRLLHLQRHRPGHPLAARPGRRARRLRRRGRPPR
jgi:acetoin utilization protein AcuC